MSRVAPSNLLAQQTQREVAACTGCDECLVACPIPEASLVAIAELNAAVMAPLLSRAGAPDVARFVDACTQCGACVPACPADLSRAAMVLSNKQRLDGEAPDRRLLVHAGREVEPSAFTLDELARDLAELRLFHGVALEEIRRLAGSSTLRRLRAGETLCEAGEDHGRLVVVLAGVLEQRAGHGHRSVTALTLGPGSFLGEMAVLAGEREPFEVVARKESVVLEAPAPAIDHAMRRSNALRRTLEALHARRAIHGYVSRALGALPEAAVTQLLAHASLAALHDGEVLVAEGDPPRDVIVVRAGFLRITRAASGRRETLSYVTEGDVLGAIALLLEETASSFTVTAVGRVEVLRIPGAAFTDVLEEHPDARVLADTGFPAERAARRRHLERPALVVAIDQTICTACNGCVEACGRRHGATRLELSGMQVGPTLYPTACSACDDPVCLMCSVGGIVRKPGGAVALVAESCIGCGACVERCPYGNIQMHAVEATPPSGAPRRGLVDRFMGFLRGPPLDDRPADRDPELPRSAVTCDHCAGYEDDACVTACPVGAASRGAPPERGGTSG